MERRQQVVDEVFGLYECFGDCDYICLLYTSDAADE